MLNVLDQKTTVRDIAAQIPAARKVLEKYGIDYCCGGFRPLEEAAAEKNADMAELLADLETARQAAQFPGGEKDWFSAPVTEIVDHIEQKHHTFMKEQLPRLDFLLGKVGKAHGEQHGQMLASLRDTFQELRMEIEGHLEKEEQILFPYIREIEASVQRNESRPAFHCGTIENPIHRMEEEHESAGGALARMRELTSDYTLPADACPSFSALYDGLQDMERDLHEHIHLENNILFPRAIELEHKSDE